MTRRVLVLNHFAVPLGAPGGTRHAELFNELHDWEYLILAARRNPSTHTKMPPARGFRFVCVPDYRKNGLSRIANWCSYTAYVCGYALFAKAKPDVVFASSPHLLAGVAGAFTAARWNVPLVLEIRDLWPRVLLDMGQLSDRSLIYYVLKRIESWLYRCSDRIVVLANGVGEALRSEGVPSARITCIPNAANPEDFVPRLARNEARTKYGFDKFTFLYAGAHGPANGLDLLLDAAADLQENCDIVLVGDGVAKPELVTRAREMRLSNVRFLDAVPKSEIPDLLSAADVCVHCLADVALFKHGVSPNKLFDYMAAGRPVLTNTPGEVGDLVNAAQSGVAVAHDELASGMREMLAAHSGTLCEWSRAGVLYMSRHQSRTLMARRLERLLDDVCRDEGPK